VQPFSSPVHENIMELLIMMDALRSASARRITAVIPYYSYARSDKKDAPRISIAGRLMADLLVTAGANRVLTMTLQTVPHASGMPSETTMSMAGMDMSGCDRPATPCKGLTPTCIAN